MSDDAPPKSRRRLIFAAALAALLPALGTGLWSAAFRMSAEERRLVGAWRADPPAAGGRPYVIEIEHAADRTASALFLDPATGAVVRDVGVGRWRVVGGRLETYLVRNPLPRRLGGVGVFVQVGQSYALEWDGPNRVTLRRDPDDTVALTLWRVR